jgi:hypothetical protein
MDFHEESIDTRSGRGAGQRLDKFPLATGFRPTTPRQLNAVRRIEDDRIPETSHKRKGSHIHNKIVVAE